MDLSNNKISALIHQEKFHIRDIKNMESHIVKHYEKLGVLLRVHSSGHLKFNIIDYLWLLLIQTGRMTVETPLVLFMKIKSEINFEDLISRYLMTRDDAYIIIKYQENDIIIRSGIKHLNEILITNEKMPDPVSISELLDNPTILVFSVKHLVKIFIKTMTDIKKTNELKHILLTDNEIFLINAVVNDNVQMLGIKSETVSGKINIDTISDLILNKEIKKINCITKDNNKFTVKTDCPDSIKKDRILNNKTPVYFMRTNMEIQQEMNYTI